MNSTTDMMNKAKPEAIEPHKQPISYWLEELCNVIINAFERRNEAIFWQKRNRDGNVYWQGYDSASDRTIYLASDDEARIWLDQSRQFR